MDLLQLNGIDSLKQKVICEHHFDVTCFRDASAKKKTLNRTAVSRKYDDQGKNVYCFWILQYVLVSDS